MDTAHFIFDRGKFYNANQRGKAGLNWAINPVIPNRIRECKDAICIPQSLLRFALMKNTIEVKIYKTPKKEASEYGGTFKIPTNKVKKWILTNGFCTFSSGKQAIAIPTIMWERIDLPMMQDNKQMNLNFDAAF